MDFVELLSGTVLQGLIYALVSFGVYITYSILDFPDLGVDGTFPLGAAVTAVLLTQGVNAWATLPIALVVGALAGLITGFVHVRLRVRNLLAGIITMTALYSVNLLLAGSNLTVDRATDTIFTSSLATGLLGDMTLTGRKLVVSLVLVIVVKLVLDGLIDTLNMDINKGFSVQLGEFGCFRPGINAKSQDKLEDVKASTIYRRKIIFTPGFYFKDMLTRASVEKMDWSGNGTVSGGGSSKPNPDGGGSDGDQGENPLG